MTPLDTTLLHVWLKRHHEALEAALRTAADAVGSAFPEPERRRVWKRQTPFSTRDEPTEDSPPEEWTWLEFEQPAPFPPALVALQAEIRRFSDEIDQIERIIDETE